MNPLDGLLILVLAISVIAGAWRGLVQEILALAGVVVGVLAALVLAPSVAAALERWITYPTAAYATAFILLFLLVMVVVAFLARLLTKVLKATPLGALNHVLGGVFGVVRGVIIGVVIVLGITLFLEPRHQVLVESKGLPYLAWGAKGLANFLPEEPRAALRDKLDEILVAREGSITI